MNANELNKHINELNLEIKRLNHAKWKLQTQLHIQFLKDQGLDEQTINRYIAEDQLALDEALDFKEKYNALRNNFFGYPGNLNEDTYVVRQLRMEESELYYVNNAGDPYENSYGAMDGKIYERKLLELFYKRFGLNAETSWGYITTGGSESNLWAILNGFRKVSNGRLYFCEAAHYSVEKSVRNKDVSIFPYTIIPSLNHLTDAIDEEVLIHTIEENIRLKKENPILLLTWGTTKFGSIDNIIGITKRLKEKKINYYLHVDAAFYGGIPKNQIDAPVCPSMSELGAHSISISFHKYFGVPNINSVLLSVDKTSGIHISYLRQQDTTISGSRSFAIFSAFQRIKEILERSPSHQYSQNIEYFKSRLNDFPIIFHRDGLSNIIVIPKPSDELLQKYQLATFEGKSGQISLAHFILNPFHQLYEIEQLMQDIYHDQLKEHRELDQ